MRSLVRLIDKNFVFDVSAASRPPTLTARTQSARLKLNCIQWYHHPQPAPPYSISRHSSIATSLWKAASHTASHETALALESSLPFKWPSACPGTDLVLPWSVINSARQQIRIQTAGCVHSPIKRGENQESTWGLHKTQNSSSSNRSLTSFRILQNQT